MIHDNIAAAWAVDREFVYIEAERDGPAADGPAAGGRAGGRVARQTQELRDRVGQDVLLTENLAASDMDRWAVRGWNFLCAHDPNVRPMAAEGNLVRAYDLMRPF